MSRYSDDNFLTAIGTLEERRERCRKPFLERLKTLTSGPEIENEIFPFPTSLPARVEQLARLGKPVLIAEEDLHEQDDDGEDIINVWRLVAQKQRNGSIKWGVGRQRILPGENLPFTTKEEIARVKLTETANRCACTEKELVALDAILEQGSPSEKKRAERLMKACRRGGGVLEGATRRKKRRR